jgi:hypothetical protein
MSDDNKQKVLRAVKENGRALKYADDFKKDRDVVIAAVKQDGLALEYASDELRADEEIVPESSLTKFECAPPMNHIQNHIGELSESYFSDSLRFVLSAKGEIEGLRTKFIKLFLERLPGVTTTRALGNTHVLREYPLQGKKGSVKKLDLLFLNLDSNLIIGIENKFLGEDSDNQLDTYYELLSSQFYPTHSIYLVYLTLDGRTPKHNKKYDKIINLSWLDLRSDIEQAHKEVAHNNKRIEDLINYLNYISYLKELRKDFAHPFNRDEFAKELHTCLGKEWDRDGLEFTRGKVNAKNSIHKFSISVRKLSCVFISKDIKVHLPFSLNGQQINLLITNFVLKLNTVLDKDKPVKLDNFFNIPYREYQIYEYLKV